MSLTRMATMAARMKKDLPEFVRLFSPADEKNYGIYIRVRAIHKTGKCCGVTMTIEELREAIHLCTRESVKDKHAYLCACLSRIKIQRTLDYLRGARNVAKSEQMRFVTKTLTDIAEWQQNVICGLLGGKYSMSDVVDMCELAKRKDKPAYYLIGILKKGYQRLPAKS